MACRIELGPLTGVALSAGITVGSVQYFRTEVGISTLDSGLDLKNINDSGSL